MSRQTIYTPTAEGRVLRAAWILSSKALPRSQTNAYIVRLGVGHEAGEVAEVGSYDGTKQALKVMTSERMTGESVVAQPIPMGGVVCVDVEQRGRPDSGAGLAVQLLLGRSAPFDGPRVEDREMRSAFDGMADELRGIGVDEEVVTVPLLVGLWRGAADLSETDGDTTSSSASWTALRSVVPTFPGSGTFQILLWGAVSFKSSDAAGANGFVRIVNTTRSTSSISVEVGAAGNAVGDESCATVLAEMEVRGPDTFELQYYHSFGTGMTITSAQLLWLVLPKES